MANRRNQYEDWIRAYLQPRFPDLVAPFRAAVGAADDALRKGELTPEALATVVAAARSPVAAIGENLAKSLGALAESFEPARDAIRELARDAHQQARINALTAAACDVPASLKEEVVCLALRDESTRLRELAASRICEWGFTHLLPQIDAAIAREPSASTRGSLEFNRALLVDGYHVRQTGAGQVWVTFRVSGGSFVSEFLNESDPRLKDLPALARSFGVKC